MIRRAFLVAIAAAFAVPAALAHQPRLVRDKPSIEVRDPEISQAFYAWLNGSVQSYYVRSETPFRLYLNLLVPDLPGIATDFTAVVYAGEVAPENFIATLSGAEFAWRKFYEPFAGDRYLRGPELDRDVPSGTYVIVVSRPVLAGKYALAVGKKESFPPGEILRTLRILPRLKKEFFGKPAVAGYLNMMGAAVAVAVIGIVGILSLIF
jgi:hypothetical protein